MAVNNHFELVKNYYDAKLWDLAMVKNAVSKWITAEEFKTITGQTYVA